LALGSLVGLPLGLVAFRYADPILVRAAAGAMIFGFAILMAVSCRRSGRSEQGKHWTAFAMSPGLDLVRVKSRLAPLVGWWRGDISLLEAQRIGLRLEGQKADVRAFPGWFERYAFARVAPAPDAITERIVSRPSLLPATGVISLQVVG
jgi:hypothetical protein